MIELPKNTWIKFYDRETTHLYWLMLISSKFEAFVDSLASKEVNLHALLSIDLCPNMAGLQLIDVGWFFGPVLVVTSQSRLIIVRWRNFRNHERKLVMIN